MGTELSRGGSQIAANFADAFGEANLAQEYRQAATEIRAGAEAPLWRADPGRFARMACRAECAAVCTKRIPG